MSWWRSDLSVRLQFRRTPTCHPRSSLHGFVSVLVKLHTLVFSCLCFSVMNHSSKCDGDTSLPQIPLVDSPSQHRPREQKTQRNSCVITDN